MISLNQQFEAPMKFISLLLRQNTVSLSDVDISALLRSLIDNPKRIQRDWLWNFNLVVWIYESYSKLCLILAVKLRVTDLYSKHSSLSTICTNFDGSQEMFLINGVKQV